MTPITPNYELEKKKRFAVELLKQPNDAFKIAAALFEDNVGKALEVSRRWPEDPDVLNFMEQATEELGDLHFLPTKAQLARAAYDIGIDQRMHVEDRLKAMRLYADIRGFIEKNGPTTNVNVLTTDKVMLVKDHGSTDNWEQMLAAQQQKLIDDANAPRTN